MGTTKLLSVFAFSALILLSGCQSSNLIDLNSNYIDLVKQQNEIGGLVINGLGETDAETIRSGLQVQFANIGDQAMKAAEQARAGADKIKARRNEASYLSLATRSYLSSGRIADHKAVEPSRRGIRACDDLTGLQSLPTTCGYFHIALFVGAYNEAIRSVRPIFSRALSLKPGQKLATADGRALEAAVGKIVAQLKGLTETGADSRKINWADAAQGLRTNFNTQQNKFLCNAFRLQARIINAASDSSWNAADVQRKTKKINDDWVRELSKRPSGFRRGRDCKGSARL